MSRSEDDKEIVRELLPKGEAFQSMLHWILLLVMSLWMLHGGIYAFVLPVQDYIYVSRPINWSVTVVKIHSFLLLSVDRENMQYAMTDDQKCCRFYLILVKLELFETEVI